MSTFDFMLRYFALFKLALLVLSLFKNGEASLTNFCVRPNDGFGEVTFLVASSFKFSELLFILLKLLASISGDFISFTDCLFEVKNPFFLASNIAYENAIFVSCIEKAYL